MLGVYDEQLRAAEKAQTSYSEFVAGLLRAQWHERQESALEWRIRRANLPERWSLESFPWARQPGVNRKQMRTFAELDFVAKHENLVLTGPTGVGKTGLACGLLLKALQSGPALTRPPSPPLTNPILCETLPISPSEDTPFLAARKRRFYRRFHMHSAA